MARPRGVSASAIYPSRSSASVSPLSRVTSVPGITDIDEMNSPNHYTSLSARARSRTVTSVAASTISERDEEEDGDDVSTSLPQHPSLAELWGKKRIWSLEVITKTRSEPPKKSPPENQSPDYEQTRECVAKAAASILGAAGEVTHELLSVSIHALEFVPVPGLATAAKTLLTIWDAVQLVDMNKSACLRLTERCASTLLSIRSDVMEAGDSVKDELGAPITTLVNSFEQIYAFLQKQIERPFLKRLLKRDDILKELESCDDELTNAISMFSLSVQIRILRHLQDLQRDYSPGICADFEVNSGSPISNRRFSASSQITLLNGPPLLGHSLTEGRVPPIMQLPSASNIPEAQVLPTLRNLHSNQNVLDKERDLDALRRLMRDALAAGNDIEMMNVLQIERREMPDAIGTLQRMLEKTNQVNEETENGVGEGETADKLGTHELDRRFIESGIDALQRMSRGTLMPLPNWTITKYEVEVEDKIGMGFFSDVYKGTWQGRTVAIKVLAETTPRQLFIREVEIWKDLNHENVLKLFGASSAQADPPHFFVSPYEKNGSLVDYLKRLNTSKEMETSPQLGSDSDVQTTGFPSEYDPLRYMYEIAKGMQYLHEHDVMHGDLKACNVLVEDDGRCVISDFGQSEMKSEVYRISGKPQPHGTLRWQAPELMSGNGPNELTPYMDVWSFAICCSEILNMGRMPWPLLDDNAVRWVILSQDERPSIPENQYNTEHLQSLLSACWSRVGPYRPVFSEIVQEIVFIRVQAQGPCDNSGSPCLSPFGLMMWDWEGVPEVFMRTPLSRIPSGREPSIFGPSSSPLVRNMSRFSRQESLNRSASFSTITQQRPTIGHRRTASSSSGVQMPEPQIYYHSSSTQMALAQGFGTPPSCGDPPSPAPELSSLGGQGRYSPPPPPTAKEAKKIKRASVSNLIALPVQNSSQVSFGAVGYYRGSQDFVTLFNSFHPEEAAMKAVRGLPSLWDYIEGGSEGRSRFGRMVDNLMGLLVWDRDKAESPVCGSPGTSGKRRSLPPRDKPVGPQAKYHYFDNKGAEKWLKEHEPTIIKVFGPSHHVKKGEVKIVTGTYGQPEQPNGLGLACISTSFSVGAERGLGIADGTNSATASPIIAQASSPARSSPIPIKPSTSNRRWSKGSGSILNLGQF